MKTRVLNIQPTPDANSLEIWMSIGERQRQFKFSQKFDRIANRQLQVIIYEGDFGETFKFNQHIVGEVMNLVRQFYKGNRVELPQEVGDFGTPEQAIALQKPFNPPKVIETDPESILTDQGLDVYDSQEQEKHLQFVESFYRRIHGHITGTSEYRSCIRGSIEPGRLMPTGYLSPPPPQSAKMPSSSQQQNNFRPSNCGLAINLAPDWHKKSLPIELNVCFSVFLPKLDLSKVAEKSLRPMWQRSDVRASIRSSLQDLLLDDSPTLAQLNRDIAEQIRTITETHYADPLAWLLRLDPIIDDLTEQEVTFAKENHKRLQAELRNQRIVNKKKKDPNNIPAIDRDVQPGQVAPVSFKVTVEVQKRNLGGQTRLRLFLRNKSEEILISGEPRDTGVFGACLEI